MTEAQQFTALKNLLALMKEERVKRVFIRAMDGIDVEVELDASAFSRPEVSAAEAVPTKQAIGADAGYPTDEELLFMSSPYQPAVKTEDPEVSGT